MAAWKKILTEVDKSSSGVADNEAGLVTGNQVFDYIAAQNFGTGSGDIEGVTAGDGITGGATSGTATVAVDPDGVTIELSASDGSGKVRAKTAAIANGGTGLATADQIYDHVTTRINGLTSNDGTVTSVTAGAGLTQTGTNTVDPTLNVVGGDGITANADEIEVAVDGVTIELSASDGTGTVRAKTAAIANGGTGLATADQIYDHVTTRINGLTSNAGTVTGVTGGTNITSDGDSTSPTLDLDANLVDIASVSADHIAAGQTDTDGNDLTFNGGQGTGTGTGGDIFFKVAAKGAASASTVNALATALTISAPTTAGGDSVVTIAGDLVVNGATSSVDVQTLTVEDKTILVADGAGSGSNADGSGLIVDTTSTTANRAHLLWDNTSLGVTGWELKQDGAPATNPAMGIAVMNKTATSGAPTATDMPTGAMTYVSNATGRGLYIYLDT